MKRIYRVLIWGVVLAFATAPAVSDPLTLRNGQTVTGYYEGGSPRVVRFQGADGVKDYDILTIAEIRFGNLNSANSSIAESVRLRNSEERVTRPVSENAASTAFTVPAGSKMTIRLTESIDSEVNKAGDVFVATLAEPLIVDGVEVAPKYADVRGRITQAEDANRIAGSAELGLELSQIVLNGIPYPLSTREYQEVAKSRGGQTARRVGGGAAIGAVIGAIAGGGKGAAVGAGVGAGAGTAVQVLTKGQKLRIPSETTLEFTLRAPLVIAAK